MADLRNTNKGMEVLKSKGNFSSAYKLSRSTIDKKVQRRERRSIEQKEFRQEHVNKRRNLHDLSPLQEGDHTLAQDQTYSEKTPRKPRVNQVKKGQERLEQLKRWKEERERKRRMEVADSKKKVFRVSKQIDHKDTELFAKTGFKKHPVKPQPAPVGVPTNGISKTAVTSGNLPTKGEDISSNRSQATSRNVPHKTHKVPPQESNKPQQSSSIHKTATEKQSTGRALSKGTAGRDKTSSKLKTTASKQASALRTARNHVDTKVEPSTRVTRQSARNKSGSESKFTPASVPKPVFEPDMLGAATPSPPQLNLTNVNSRRGADTSGIPDSFAPADFTFNISSANVTSFVFRPLSPASAANFLCPNQDTSSASFLDTNPNRSSTPKRNRERKNASQSVLNETADQTQDCTQIDSTISKMPDQTVISSPEAKKQHVRQSRSTTRSRTNPDITSDVDRTLSVSDIIEAGSARRTRSRKQTKTASDSDSQSDIDVIQMGSARHTRSTRRTKLDSNLDSQRDEGDAGKASAKAETQIIKKLKKNSEPDNSVTELGSSAIQNEEKKQKIENANSDKKIVKNLAEVSEVENINSPVKRSRRSVASVSTTGTEGRTPRRSTRRSVANIEVVQEDIQNSDGSKDLSVHLETAESASHLKNSDLAMDIAKDATPANLKNAGTQEQSKAKPRRSLRRSVLAITEIVEEISNSEDESSKPKNATKHISETDEDKSGNESKDALDAEVFSPAKRRRSTRRSVVGTDMDDPKESSEIRKSRKSIALASESQVISDAPETTSTAASICIANDIEKTSTTPYRVSAQFSDDLGESDKENITPDNRSIMFQQSSDSGVGLEDDQKTPRASTKKNLRNKSFGGFRLPSDSVVLSGKRSAKRKTMHPKSPEEWIEVLSNSPMVEMSRRKSKAGNTSVPALSFDDFDLEPNSSTAATEDKVTASGSDGSKEDNEVSPVAMDTEENGQPSEPAQDQAVVQVGEVSSTQNGLSTDESSSDEEHDVLYFRKLLCTETNRLNDLNDHWNNINDNTQLSEEIRGQIRTTVGQSRLLMDQRFKQFSGLVDNCEFKTGEKETTCTDLEGFWEMIYFQVEDVDKKFADLKRLQANGWVQDNQPEPDMKKIKKKLTKVAVKKPVVKSKFAAFRAQMKKPKDNSVSTPGPESEEEEKVFEVPGFFRVASPIRSPKPHCEVGTPKKSTPPTSEETDSEKSELTSLQVPKTSNILANRTPSRKSYVPVIPSPLLKDTTPLPRPSRACTQKTPIPKRLIDDVDTSDATADTSDSKRAKTTPARRSLRPRKSVNFADVEVLSPKAEGTDADFARLLQPMSSTECLDESVNILDDSLSKYIQPMNALDKEDSPKQRKGRRSSLKGCRSTERRRSRQRSVHFVSPSVHDEQHVKLPHTPYNRNSLVKQKRVTRKSVEPVDDVFSIDNIDNDENVPPPSFRSPRPSLLGTPPDIKKRSAATFSSVPTATLISFTP